MIFHDLYLSFRILKGEYTKTNNKVIGKSRFPSLLSVLWEMDPVKAKTNLVKSFMRAGIFPFNPNAIDRSRILTTTTCTPTSSSNTPITMTNCPPVDPSIGSSRASQLVLNNQTMPDQQLVFNRGSSQPRVSGFGSSREAIAALDRVLQTTGSSSGGDDDLDDDDDDDHDEDFLLYSRHGSSSIAVSSSTSQYLSTKPLTNKKVNSIRSVDNWW